MPDPVTNVEIEDVLSSIRRLVANGRKEREAARAAPPAEERLVLSPSLRVDDDSPRPAEPDGFIWKDLAEDERPDGAAHAHPDAADDAADLAAPERTYPDDVAAAEAPLDDSLTAGEPETLAQPQSEFPQESPKDAIPEETPAAGEASGASAGREAQVAGFEAAVADRDDQWEPDGPSEDAFAGHEVPTLDWRDVSEDPEQHESTASRPEEAAWPGPDAPAPEEVEDEGPAQDLAESARDAAPSPDAEPATERGPAPEAGGITLDDAVLDEETLRDMVAEIVRQELQGALGERITRNVRKLVRREIHRALTSQDFD